MIKGKEILKRFEKLIDELYFWQILQKRKIKQRIETLESKGLSNYYDKLEDGSYRLVEFYDPDLDVRNRIKEKEIMDGNEVVSSCPNCYKNKFGGIFVIDPIEKIGQCNKCFTEFKLS